MRTISRRSSIAAGTTSGVGGGKVHHADRQVGREGAGLGAGDHPLALLRHGAFPANLPVGMVHFSAANVPEVVPAAMLDRLEVVRIFDYGLGGITAPEAPGRLPERRGR